MATGFFTPPLQANEPVLNYEPGSPERSAIIKALEGARSKEVEIPMYIGGEAVFTENKQPIHPPHDLSRQLGFYNVGDETHVEDAINAALGAREQWSKISWENRAGIFLKAADLIAGPYRAKINAATMLGQSKNVYQAEIDSACELIDFLRFNVRYMSEIYASQPASSRGVWNRMEYRPLEGFVLAVTPFNFTAIAGNLPSAPALLGNTVVWKPSFSQVYSADVIKEVFILAGLPEGVINVIYTDPEMTANIALTHPEFAGIHFTGSAKVFKNIWKTIGGNIHTYRNYPRIVGETGGKDFIIAHETADVKALVAALIRGSFEYQGQKCSAVSRAYIPSNLWKEVEPLLLEEVKQIRMGDVMDFGAFMNAVINENAFDKISGYIENARKNSLVEIIAGGGCDKSKGYFIQPTILLTKDPLSITMREELFGPVLTIYLYHENRFEEALELVDNATSYGLTGAVFARDRHAIQLAAQKLTHAAGNFYINDKPTGAVVGQQPFGGGRWSGTNDKAGSMMNLLRWTSARAIKENFDPPVDFRYPFMKE